MSNLFNDLANGKYKLKGTNTVNNTNQSQNSKGNLFNDLANGKYKLKETAPTSAVSAQPSAVNKSGKPTYSQLDITKFTEEKLGLDATTLNKAVAQKEAARKEAERQEQERWNNLSLGEKIADPFKTAATNVTYGNLGIKENVAWNEYRNKQDEASLQAAQAATKAREEFEATNDRIGKGNAVTKDFAQYLPQLGGQLKAGAVGAAGGAGAGAVGGAGIALAAGQLGPQVAVPEEIATVPAGALTGAIWGGRGGYVTGTAKYGYDMMAGSAYKTLLDMGVPNDVALELSGDEALISSLIEGGGAIVDLISLGIGKLAGKGGTTAAKEVAKNRLIAAAKAYGLNLVSEPLEEMAQEKVSIETEKRAADKTGIERNVTSAEDWERIKGAGETALKVAAVSGGLNAGGNYITNNIAENINNNRQTQAQINQDIKNYKNIFNDSENITQDNAQNTNDVKNVLRELPQNAEVQQPNVTLPTQAEMAQKANMNQIRGNTKLMTQKVDNKPTNSFQRGLEKFNSKKYSDNDNIVILDETPLYLYNLGYDADKPIVLNMTKLETIMKEPKGTFDGKNHHGITMDIIEQLPQAIQNPLNVIKNPKFRDRFVIITELTDQYGDIVIVPIEMNTNGYIENIETDVNRIASVYGKENYDVPKRGGLKSYIENNKNNIVYDIDNDITKNKSNIANPRLQLPSTNNIASNNIIPNNDTNINTQYAQNVSNDTADTQSAFSMPEKEQHENPSNQKNELLEEVAPINEKELENVEEKERVASVLTRSPKKPAKDLLKQSKDVFMRKIVDAGHTIDTVGKLTGDKHLYQYFNNAKQVRQSAEYMIGEAQTDIRGNRIGNSLIEVFESVRAKGDDYTNKFFEYLLHMHNIDRMAQNKPIFGKSVTAEDSSRYVKELLEKYPEFEKQANKVYAYNKNLMQWRVDSGLISQEQADLMNQMYPHYVPTFRDVSGTSGSRAMQGTVQIANTVRKATGSDKDIMPIDASMARQTMQTVQAAKRNLLGNRLLNDVLNNKDKVGEYVQAVEKVNEQNDVETEMESPKDTNLEDNNNVFKIFRNGETYVMKVNNGIYEGLKSISSEIDNTDTGLLLKPVKAANNAFKKLITGYSPMFTIRNFARDIQDAGLYSKNLREFLKKYPNAYQEMMGNGKMWQMYKSLGGTGSSFFDYETGIEKTLDSRNKASTKIKEVTVGKVEELNMMIEQAPRFAEFMATIEKAGNQNYDTLMEAMLNAADITVNFGRSGTVVKEFNSTFVPFLNPSIQGFDKFTRTILESRDGKKFAKLAIRATLLGILPSVINELLYWDDDEYENLTDRDKDTNFLIKTGDNKWLKIPKGRVLSIFGNTAARGLRTLKGEEWDAGEFLKNQASQTAPISVLESNIASPIQAVKNNKTWYGSDIVPQRLQDYAPKDQYDENTDAFSKWLGGKINYSPKKINYLIDAYTGIIGDVVLPLMTPKAETNPFTKAFVLDGVSSNEISNDFYDMMDKYNTKQNPKKSAKEVSRYLNKQSKQVSDIFKQVREVENSDLSDAEKRKQVRELRELANTIELIAMAVVPEYEKAVDKYRGTFSDEDVDSDYAYLFANRDIFGAEYAVKTFSESLYNNHKKENMDKFFNSYFTKQYFQKKLQPKKETTGNTLPTLAEQKAKLQSLKK